jgi:hypothetical protein
VSDGHVQVVPEVLVTGGGGSVEGLAATLMRSLGGGPDGDGKHGGAAKKALDAVVSKAEKETGKHRTVADMVPEPPAKPQAKPVDRPDEKEVPPPPVSG